VHEEQENGETVTHLSTDEARGGTTAHGVRYVLAISMMFSVMLLAIVVAIGYWVNDRNSVEGMNDGAAAQATQRRP
jgi:hypothetical protein